MYSLDIGMLMGYDTHTKGDTSHTVWCAETTDARVPQSHPFVTTLASGGILRSQTAIDIPDNIPAVQFDRNPDDGVCSLVFGDEYSTVRLIGSPDALASFFDTLRDVLVTATCHSQCRKEARG